MTQASFRSRSLSRLNRFLVAAIIVTAFGHFLVVNGLSTMGFVFKDLKLKTNDLVAERQALETKVSSLSAYQNLNPRIDALHLVAADSIRYINSDNQVVAKK
jgi:hypothetical protein